MDWNPRVPEDWAWLLGLASVPLFGKERELPVAGDHVVLLDGQASSLTFSHGSAAKLLTRDRIASWAWSSNVGHAAIVDKQSGTLFWIRADEPDEISEIHKPTPDIAVELLRKFERDPTPESRSAIEFALDSFRSLRFQIREDGGTDLDAVKAFNILLLWTDAIRTGKAKFGLRSSLGSVCRAFSKAELPTQLCKLSDRASRFPIGLIAAEFLDEHDGFSLDPYLLLRHASGTLFQEAHVALEASPSRQQRLFSGLLAAPVPAEGRATRDARYTPTSLARFLTEQAVTRFRELNPLRREIEILDPACGSGVFLVESCKTLGRSIPDVKLRGFDRTETSRTISEFTVLEAAQSLRADGCTVSLEFEQVNSLSPSIEWGSPDIILMNPPFLSWRMINDEERRQIREVLGDLYSGQSDSAIAFVAKAVRTLKPGGVLATLVPGSFLNSEAARPLRRRLSGDPDISIELIGLFRGFDYFMEAAVEPAFLMISRTQKSKSFSVVIAEPGAADRAIRGARRARGHREEFGEGFEITERRETILDLISWRPRPLQAFKFVEKWKESRNPTVGDIFDVHLGARIGAKDVMMVSREELYREASTVDDLRFFKPVADEIRNGQIVPNNHLFYPYYRGSLLLGSEEELQQSVPWFYHSRLLPNRSRLQSRKSLRSRKWWELVEPRPSWMDLPVPRIVSPAFGFSGSFAADFDVQFAVVQGNAWILKNDPDDLQLLFAYLAVLNSYEFESLLELMCPKVGGGQYELYSAHVRHLPIPDLRASTRTRSALVEAGMKIASGELFDPRALSTAVAEAYGQSVTEFRKILPPGECGQRQEVFDRFMHEWKTKSRHMSKASAMARLTSYQEIIQMGAPAIPLILRELKREPDHWFNALQLLTDADPVAPGHRGQIRKMQEDWVRWGKVNRLI